MNKKKKHKKYKDIDFDFDYKEKQTFDIVKKSNNINGDKIITSPEFPYIIIRQKVYYDSTIFHIYNKENFNFIQKITKPYFYRCFPLNETSIILSGEDSKCEIWQKNKNIFVKTKSLNTSINSNVLFNSRNRLFFCNCYRRKAEIQIWYTVNKIPTSILTKIIVDYTRVKKIFFMNNEKIFVLCHCNFDFILFFNIQEKLGITFYDTHSMKIIKNFDLVKKQSDLKVFKLDENRIIIIEKENISKFCNEINLVCRIKIMTVPEFKVVKEFKSEFPCEDILIYKNYFILYESMIKLYNKDNYQLIKEIQIRGINHLILIKENYLLALLNQYVTFTYDETNQQKDLVLYQLNI